MSGECEKCSENTLDCQCHKYFNKGKYYDDYDSYLRDIIDFDKALVDEASYQHLMYQLYLDFLVNTHLIPHNVTNYEFMCRLEEVFNYACKKLSEPSKKTLT